jgi:hypothetical protein
MDFMLGGIAGVMGVLAVQSMMSLAGRARIYEVDGRQVVEFMHRADRKRGLAGGPSISGAPRALPRRAPGGVLPGVDGMSSAGGTRFPVGVVKALPRRLRVIATAQAGSR